MITTMDRAGRLVIPAGIRRETSIKPGTPLEVRCRNGIIEIEPRPLAITLQRRGRLLIARPVKRVSQLRSTSVERTRRDLARR